MGTICILLGLIFLIAFTGGGFFLSNLILTNTTFKTLMGFAKITDASLIYIIVVGLCFLIGLIVCMNLVMHGLNSNKLNKLQAQIRRMKRSEQ